MHGTEKFVLIIAETFPFSFAPKAIFYVFDLSKCTKTCNATVVFEVALDVQSVKLKEKPEAHSFCPGHVR